MTKKFFSILLFLGFAFSSIGLQIELEPVSDETTYAVEQNNWVDSVMVSLTQKEKIAQFFMPAIYSNRDDLHKQEILDLITTYKIGGVIFFQGTPEKQAVWVNELQAAANIPLLVSIDGEWGINMRLDNTIKYPRQLTLGAIKDERFIYEMGKRIGEECKAVGVNVNLAPVMDVNNNPNNPVINDRSFGEDKFNVALKSLAYAHGMQDVGVMAVGKHFPGHGDTDKDSHKTLPVINHDIKRLNSLEFYPFKTAFENDLMGVMAAHLFIPALDNTPNLATSLSKKVTTHLLRDSLGFKGLVFSDALNMKGVSSFYSTGELDKIAFMAGNDILVFSENIPLGISLINKAVEDGEITKSELDQRVRRVLSYKFRLGLNKPQITETSKIDSFLNDYDGLTLQKVLFEKAITLAANEKKTVPLSVSPKIKMASLMIGANDATNFQGYISAYRDCIHYVSNKDVTDAQSIALVNTLKNYDKVIVGVYDMSRWSSKNYGFSAAELTLLRELNLATEVIVVLFGTPYSLKHFDNFNSVLVAYEENLLTEEAAANALFGAITINGKLPVSAGKYKSGEGIELVSKNILQFGISAEAKLSNEAVENIDALAQKAIDINATPGCQVLVAHNGKIVYNKSFGNFTYDNTKSVDNNTIYDLASITKIAATTLSIMKLYEEKKVDLEQSLDTYLPYLTGTKVGGLKINHVMAHQSGLPAWIPFYHSTIEDSVYNNWYNVDSTAAYCVVVADGLYICKDSTDFIWKTIEGVEIKENPDYKYSDLGFYLLMQVVEKISGKTLDVYAEENFYKPMGLYNIGFKPHQNFDVDKIPPTENDRIFRKQEVKGYVHDPGAAMLGGVSGHAGLFSNAKDLAAIMQMLLNEGTYNGKRLLKAETVNYFTTPQFIAEDNRRGLGFDKPVLKENNKRDGGPTCEEVSDLTFGHTGFTGTAAWADPENGLVFIFLSNRTFPNASNKKLITKNIRTDIQSEIYKGIGVY